MFGGGAVIEALGGLEIRPGLMGARAAGAGQPVLGITKAAVSMGPARRGAGRGPGLGRRTGLLGGCQGLGEAGAVPAGEQRRLEGGELLAQLFGQRHEPRGHGLLPQTTCFLQRRATHSGSRE